MKRSVAYTRKSDRIRSCCFRLLKFFNVDPEDQRVKRSDKWNPSTRMSRTEKGEAPNFDRVLRFLYHQDVACFWLIPSGLWVQVCSPTPPVCFTSGVRSDLTIKPMDSKVRVQPQTKMCCLSHTFSCHSP